MRNGIFISYSHSDRQWVDKLLVHLKPALRGEDVVVWDDQKIQPGAKWAHEIDRALSNARVAILLVSPDFLASNFIQEVELPRILESADNSDLTILWIPIRSSLYEKTPLKNYQAAFSPSVLGVK